MNDRKYVRNVCLAALLCVVCLLTAELLVCRTADPVLYERIVTPVRQLYHSGRLQVKHLSEECVQWAGDRAADAKALVERQRRAAAVRRLKKKMVTDQRALMEQLREMQIASSPLLTDGGAPYQFTELLSRDGQEYLTGGNVDVCYFNQGDEAWGGQLFGRDPIRSYGCGPTAMAMVVSSLTEDSVNPAAMAAWSALSGYCAPGNGSYLSIVDGVSKRWGLQCTPLSSLDAETLTEALSAGGLAVALMGPGHFTARGHFIVLRGVTLSGEVLVADPNSRENSLAVWDPALLIEELSPSRHEGAPLWMVAAPAEL